MQYGWFLLLRRSCVDVATSANAVDLCRASRFIGSYIAVVSVELRRMHWPEAFDWLDWPMAKWHMVVCVGLDVGYVLMLRHVKIKERIARKES